MLWYTVFATHITIICITIYLHRSQTHNGVSLHVALSHFMRFWLWLTTGTVTKEWVATHRKHHRYSDQAGDPHSPYPIGIKRFLIRSASLYQFKTKPSQQILDQYGSGTPNDWIEQNLYSKYPRAGLILFTMVNLFLFSWWGLLVTFLVIWFPSFGAAGIVNGLGHWWGYKNKETNDHSRNILPLGILIGGEELHNNHHIDSMNPKFSKRWFEVDIGWMWINIFKALGLIQLKK